MNKYDVIPSEFNNVLQQYNAQIGFANAFGIFMGPLQKYFIVKSQKDIMLKRMEYAAEAREAILKTIENIAISGKHDEVLYNMLMTAYYKTL